MRKKFPLEGLENLEIEIDQSLWTGKTKIYCNGEPITKRKQDKYYEIKMEDGSIKRLIIKRTSFDPIPRIYIDKQEIKLARNLFWYEYLIVFFPLIFVFFGGAIGGLWGALSTIYNFRIIRSNMRFRFKLLCISTSILLTLILYFFSAFLFQILIS